jgi:hypothetical protein
MFCLKVMLNFEVSRCFEYLKGMPADRTEFPFLETIHIHKSPAGGAPDNKVHNKEVMRVIPIKIYRMIGKFPKFRFTKIISLSKKMKYLPGDLNGLKNETALLSDLLIQMVLWNKSR